jgi:hypothetical protein
MDLIPVYDIVRHTVDYVDQAGCNNLSIYILQIWLQLSNVAQFMDELENRDGVLARVEVLAYSNDGRIAKAAEDFLRKNEKMNTDED